MKCKIRKIEPKKLPRPELKPFEVIFTVQNESDLGYLVAILNLNESKVRNVSDYPCDVKWEKPENGYDYWRELDVMLQDHLENLKAWRKATAQE